MTNKERNLIKKKIHKCLTEDFKGNQAIFGKKEGWAIFRETDLYMVMGAVVKGLEMAKHEINEKDKKPLVGRDMNLDINPYSTRDMAKLKKT